jgi:hypothetical protein
MNCLRPIAQASAAGNKQNCDVVEQIKNTSTATKIPSRTEGDPDTSGLGSGRLLPFSPIPLFSMASWAGGLDTETQR